MLDERIEMILMCHHEFGVALCSLKVEIVALSLSLVVHPWPSASKFYFLNMKLKKTLQVNTYNMTVNILICILQYLY